MYYLNKSINFFLNELKSKKPVPGGGSVASLSATLACGLLIMVSVFSQPKKKTKKSLKAIERKVTSYLERLKKITEEDISSFKAFSKVIKAKKKDNKRVKKALLKTLKPPLATLRTTPLLMLEAKKLIKLSKRNIISDVAVAASLILASFEAAKVNVKINLKYLSDARLASKIGKEMARIEKKIKMEKKSILKGVYKVL